MKRQPSLATGCAGHNRNILPPDEFYRLHLELYRHHERYDSAAWRLWLLRLRYAGRYEAQLPLGGLRQTVVRCGLIGVRLARFCLEVAGAIKLAEFFYEWGLRRSEKRFLKQRGILQAEAVWPDVPAEQ